MQSRLLLAAVLALLVIPVSIFARDAHEQGRIDFLIHAVETSKGLTFARNGSEYDGLAAARHLRMKLDYAGERVKSAEEFIKHCASESSVTHRPYRVRTADGATVDAAIYFTEQLREFDRKKP